MPKELIQGLRYKLPDDLPRDRDSWKEGNQLLRFHDSTASSESVCLNQLFAYSKRKNWSLRTTKEYAEEEVTEAEEWRGNTAQRTDWRLHQGSTFEILDAEAKVRLFQKCTLVILQFIGRKCCSRSSLVMVH